MKKEIKLWLEIEHWLRVYVYPTIGMDEPHNHDEIVEFIENDVKETADPEDYHSGDFGIAFRRWVEAQSENQP